MPQTTRRRLSAATRVAYIASVGAKLAREMEEMTSIAAIAGKLRRLGVAVPAAWSAEEGPRQAKRRPDTSCP